MQTDSAGERGGVGMDEGTVAAIEVGAEEEEEVDGGEGGEEGGGVDRGKEDQLEVWCQEVPVAKEGQETVSEVNKNNNNNI